MILFLADKGIINNRKVESLVCLHYEAHLRSVHGKWHMQNT